MDREKMLALADLIDRDPEWFMSDTFDDKDLADALRAAPARCDAQNDGLRRLLKEARQYVSDAGGDWDMETRTNSQNLLDEIDRALTQPSARREASAQCDARSDEVVWLREVDAGTDNACWVISNRIDPSAVPFFMGIDAAACRALSAAKSSREK